MEFHATPYTYDAKGFYFDTLEEYQTKYQAHLPCEEYEIQFIHGDAFEYEVFNKLKVGQGNLETYFETVKRFTDEPLMVQAGFLFLLDQGQSLEDAIEKASEVCLFDGTIKHYVEEHVPETLFTEDIPEVFKTYFDYDSYANDLLLSGDVAEFEFNNDDYIMDCNL